MAGRFKLRLAVSLKADRQPEVGLCSRYNQRSVLDDDDITPVQHESPYRLACLTALLQQRIDGFKTTANGQNFIITFIMFNKMVL